MRFIAILSALALTFSGPAQAAQTAATVEKPAIVLVHGAFAESASWNGVITKLVHDGYRVVAAAVPLRSLKGDADYLSSLVSSIQGPVVLVGHSYGGEVISAAATGHSNVRSLVFVAGLAPDVGESAASLGAKFPTGTLGETLAPPVPLTGGNADIYISQDKYGKQFAADVPEADAVQMAVTQRPIVQAALAEPAASSTWQTLPSWFVWGALDRNIPAALHAFMAKRAHAREAVEVPGASHVVMISHPDVVAGIIERAATAQPGK